MGMMDMGEKEPVSGEDVEDESKKCCVDCKTTKTPLWRGGPAGPKEPVSGEDVEDESKKCCVDCKTTKTPLWRGGPAGPKSLCNACGIRFRKRRISMIGTNRGCERKRERGHNHGSSASSSSSDGKSEGGDGEEEEEDLGGCGGSLRIRLMALGEGVMMVQSLPSAVKKQRCQRRRKLGEEEEQAAVSLMALSCGSVFA